MNVFDPYTHLQTVTIVGLGGTGSQVARNLARMIYDMRRARLHIPRVVFVDPDVVEEKNVGRQMFAAGDIGQSKSRVLARRFNQALGLEIEAIDQPLDARRHIERHGSLVIGCVDNHVVSQSGCSSCSRDVWSYLKVAAHVVSKWLHQPHLSLKVIAPKDQGAFYVSFHV